MSLWVIPAINWLLLRTIQSFPCCLQSRFLEQWNCTPFQSIFWISLILRSVPNNLNSNERESDLTKRIHSRTEQIESGDSFGTNSRNSHSLIGIPVLEEGIAAFIGNMRRSPIGLIETRLWEGIGLLGRQKRAILYPSGVNYRLRGLEPWPWPYTF